MLSSAVVVPVGEEMPTPQVCAADEIGMRLKVRPPSKVKKASEPEDPVARKLRY